MWKKLRPGSQHPTTVHILWCLNESKSLELWSILSSTSTYGCGVWLSTYFGHVLCMMEWHLPQFECKNKISGRFLRCHRIYRFDVNSALQSMWQCWNCPCAGVPLSRYQGCSSLTDETGVSRPRQAVSTAAVAILSEQTPSNGAVTLSLWRRASEKERMERERRRVHLSNLNIAIATVKRCWWAGNTPCVRLVWRCGERDISHVSLGQTRWILGQMEQSLSVAFIICSQTIVSVHK